MSANLPFAFWKNAIASPSGLWSDCGGEQWFFAEANKPYSNNTGNLSGLTNITGNDFYSDGSSLMVDSDPHFMSTLPVVCNDFTFQYTFTWSEGSSFAAGMALTDTLGLRSLGVMVGSGASSTYNLCISWACNGTPDRDFGNIIVFNDFIPSEYENGLPSPSTIKWVKSGTLFQFFVNEDLKTDLNYNLDHNVISRLAIMGGGSGNTFHFTNISVT
jgi:hypothetical protein